MSDRFLDSLGEHPTLFTARDEGIVFAAGEVVAGRFEVVDTLGGGGMGLVYRVRDTLMGGREKALKVILPSLMSSEKARERFVQEAEIAQGLAHPNIVNTFDLGEHRGVRFITMELLQGESLHERLQAKQKLPLDETAGIIRQVCAALDYAHRTTIHRDIKPQNIFLCAAGTVKLLDFGLARAAGSNRFTQSSMAVGTAVYLAPEQLQGQEATNRSDLYSLGVVLYQCLTGALPLGRFALPTELGASLPDALDTLVDSLLKPQPEQRPASATEVARRQETILEEQHRQEEAAALAREREAQEAAERRGPARKVFARVAGPRVVIALVVLVLMGIVVFYAIMDGKIPRHGVDAPSPGAGDGGLAQEQVAAWEAEEDSSVLEAAEAARKAEEDRMAREAAAAEERARKAEEERLASLPVALVENVRVSRATRNGAPGFLTRADLTINGLDGENVEVAVDLHNEMTGRHLEPAGEPYRSGITGGAHVSSRLTVRGDPADLKDVELFIPDSGIHFPEAGDYRIGFDVKVWKGSETVAEAERVTADVKVETSQPPPPAQEAESQVSALGMGSLAGETRRVDLGGGVKLELVWIPPGSFMMGGDQSPEEVVRLGGGKADWYKDEHPQHRVELTRGFWMGKYEVTQALWQSVVGNDPSHFKGADRPVESVSWDDCQSFLQRLNSRVSAGGFRLPTEAEWEYACRAGTTTAYSFGNNTNDLGTYAWHSANSGNETHPVGGKRANPWGLHDMHGNVWEWCQDWYGDNFYGRCPSRDPENSTNSDYRVLRGGSWDSIPGNCRSANRAGGGSGIRHDYRGIRVVLSPPR